MKYLKSFKESKKSSKENKLNIFVRFGGLDLKNQKGFGKDTFHSPPATRGFYAMPLVAQEFFLIGSLDKTQKSVFPKEPKKKISGEDENGIPICEPAPQEEWDKHSKRKDKVYTLLRKQFVKKEGNIWHHLTEWVDRNEIIAEHGSWCKTSIKAWQVAFSRVSLNRRYGEKNSGWDFSTNSINNPARAGLFGMYSKDEFEVFFDEKV